MPLAAADGDRPAMPTYRLTIEYDGSKFSGWQTQLKHRTVQGVLISALRELLGDDGLTLQGAGRTDAGVHALGQVASLRCARGFAVDHILNRLEHALPSDLAVLDIRPAAAGFHARHDAVARCYRYQITRRRSAFGKRATWWVDGALDVDRMRAAAGLFVGRHDYAAFARAGHKAPSTIVVVDDVRAVGVRRAGAAAHHRQPLSLGSGETHGGGVGGGGAALRPRPTCPAGWTARRRPPSPRRLVRASSSSGSTTPASRARCPRPRRSAYRGRNGTGRGNREPATHPGPDPTPPTSTPTATRPPPEKPSIALHPRDNHNRAIAKDACAKRLYSSSPVIYLQCPTSTWCYV